VSVTVPHPTEARRLRGVELRSLLLVRYGGRCAWCGNPLAADDACCTVDHLISGRDGGPSQLLANLAPAHAKCNGTRGANQVADWALFCELRGRQPNRPALTAALRELAGSAPTFTMRRHALRQLHRMDRDERKKAA
jgi:hypothetical protein